MSKLKLWLPLIIWCGVIFAFSSMEINHQAEFSWPDFIIKKTAHVTEYAILYWLIFRALTKKGENPSKKMFVYSLILGMFYAFSDEWHQTFVLGREGTLRDVGFDTIGMLLALNQIKRNL